MANDHARALLDAIPELTSMASLSGEIADGEMQLAVNDVLNFDEWMTGQSADVIPKIPLAEQALNRCRVIWLNHEGTVNARKAADLARQAEEQRQIDAALARQKERVEKERVREEKRQK